MSNSALKTRSGGMTTLGSETMEAFVASLRGAVITPGDDTYDESREIWNAMIDRRPGLIVRCVGAADVARCVDLARDHDLLVTVRGAGHNIAGNAVHDGVLMIDLSGMKSIRVDPGNRTVRAEPGCTLGDLDNETQRYGLVVPAGINSTTGIAGLTLGGGFGWVSRSLGMTVDNLISAEVVTAEGKLVTASEKDNADLLWGLKGGGGNFGVVTSFEYRAHPVGPEILSGLIVHPFSDAKAVLEHYREFAANAPDELTTWIVLRKAPPLPFLSEDVHGTEVVVIATMYNGDMAEGEKVLQPLRAFGNPHADVVSPHPWVGWQAAFDPLLTPGARNYWKSHNFTALSDDVISIALDSVTRLPSPHTEIFLAQMGGATNRVAPDATAYHHRDTEFIMNVHTRWESAGEDEACIAWARGLFDTLTPHASGGVYVNFMPDDETDRVGAAYGPNHDRLVALKTKWDPTNLFRLNQNIAPR